MNNKDFLTSPYLRRPVRTLSEYSKDLMKRIEEQDDMSACVARMQHNSLSALRDFERRSGPNTGRTWRGEPTP